MSHRIDDPIADEELSLASSTHGTPLSPRPESTPAVFAPFHPLAKSLPQVTESDMVDFGHFLSHLQRGHS